MAARGYAALVVSEYLLHEGVRSYPPLLARVYVTIMSHSLPRQPRSKDFGPFPDKALFQTMQATKEFIAQWAQ